MVAYIIRRLLLIVPTLFGVMVLNFAVIHTAPGGPVEHILATLQETDVSATARLSGGNQGELGPSARHARGTGNSGAGRYRGAEGIDPDFIKELERQFGFDKPAHVRFFQMIWNFLCFDFGDSFLRDRPVMELLAARLPVSVSLGLWTTVLVYLVSVPLGVAKAVRDGSRFDAWSSGVVIVGYAVPGFLFAILLIVLFAGDSFFDWFPLRGLFSDNWSELGSWQRLIDYLWHITLPVVSMVIGGFASLTVLTKNSFLEEIQQQYVITARAKGLSERRVLYRHVFRNAMLIVISGFPGAFVSALFAGALLTEIIFSLDGIGLLGFEAAIDRDYPVMFATLYLFTLLGLLLNLVQDLTYVLVDPRIDFESRAV